MITPPVPSPHSIPVHPSDPGVITESPFLLLPGCYNLVVSLHQAHNFVNPLFDCFELAISFLPDLLTIKKKNIFFYIFNKYLLSTQFKSSHCSSNWRYSKGTKVQNKQTKQIACLLCRNLYTGRGEEGDKKYILIYIHTYLHRVISWHLRGIGSRTSPTKDTKISKCSSLLQKMLQYLHMTYAHPPCYFKSSLDYL